MTLAIPTAHADPKTVCTVTINSPDEKETLQRNLPADQYRFVELVQPGKSDWFGSACRSAVRCDVLIVSGHFDDGTEFYSDHLGAREAWPVADMERAACSDSCAGVFSRLKEVYLFGCNTLEPAPLRVATAEMSRSLVRSGYSPDQADQRAREFGERYGESNRDRMRRVFKDVPVIYGFSAKAPLGASAGPALERYFRSGADGRFGTGIPSPKLVSTLASASMTFTRGLTDSDADAGVRRDVCTLADDRLAAAQKLAFVHRLLGREMAEVRMLLDRIEGYVASLSAADRATPDVAAALDAIDRDAGARDRFLTFARDADRAATRARMTALARALGWLSAGEERAELEQMFTARLSASDLGEEDVDLACTLNRDHALDLEPSALLETSRAHAVARDAVLACLGGAAARARVLRGLASAAPSDVLAAQAYLRQRPIETEVELRDVATAVLRMPVSTAQVHALEALAGYRFSDRDTLQSLTELFARATSIDLQRAVAGVLIRSDYNAIASPALARILRVHRIKSPDGADVIDALIRRLDS
ncbi:MAG TPA: hypothetical protein VL742_07855 [Casimicrobiaceae bacterium]|nr:hypothetical protein [Casimicrobiaceae bacterium]